MHMGTNSIESKNAFNPRIHKLQFVDVFWRNLMGLDGPLIIGKGVEECRVGGLMSEHSQILINECYRKHI